MLPIHFLSWHSEKKQYSYSEIEKPGRNSCLSRKSAPQANSKPSKANQCEHCVPPVSLKECSQASVTSVWNNFLNYSLSSLTKHKKVSKFFEPPHLPHACISRFLEETLSNHVIQKASTTRRKNTKRTASSRLFCSARMGFALFLPGDSFTLL